ncbi:PilZ domain protein [Enhygromyxa salina]|uniref:PilZ domain protein n=2 Tax=Enhygromyxa salina TaxID=215803 RepID=A0A2S9XKU5_9BACT|nr:PilZ domain protein [Enhygromyxa salina]
MVLEVRYRNAGQFLVSYCTNLSRGGLFVSTHEPEPVGTELVLSLRVPDRKLPVTLRARVQWNRTEDEADGPAGMGLSFADVDGVLGEHIDQLVTNAEPLSIALVGRSDHASAHLHALLRSLVTCQTRQLALRPGVVQLIGQVDLLVIDVDGDPNNALDLILNLQQRTEKPPILALCGARDPELRARVSRHARIVPTPVDKRELQLKVLETLGQVQFVRTSIPDF